MYFTVEEENLICLYHNADRRRTAANLRAALPDMDKEMAALACQTADKLDAMSDEEKIELLASDGMLVKRPLLIDDNRILVGFREKEWTF